MIINYHFEIEVLMSKCTTPSEYFRYNHRETIRYTFKENPIMQNKIVLTDKTSTTITKLRILRPSYSTHFDGEKQQLDQKII